MHVLGWVGLGWVGLDWIGLVMDWLCTGYGLMTDHIVQKKPTNNAVADVSDDSFRGFG